MRYLLLLILIALPSAGHLIRTPTAGKKKKNKPEREKKMSLSGDVESGQKGGVQGEEKRRKGCVCVSVCL